MDNYREIRERVSAEDVAKLAGLRIVGHRTACPFHGGEHDNLSFHGGGYKCWVCGAAGSSIDFWAGYYHVPIIDAAKGINDAFELGLDMYHRRERLATPTQRIDAQQAQRERLAAAYDQWLVKQAAWGHSSLLQQACSLADSLTSGFLSTVTRNSHRDDRIALVAGRKHLRHLGRNFSVLRSVWAGEASEAEQRRAAALFAAERENVRGDIVDLRQSPSLLCRQDARDMEARYAT